MSDNLQPLSDEHIEARITAWVLGEASPFEAAELDALIAQFPEHRAHLDRIRKIHSQLHETETAESDHSWKLPPEKRAKIESILGEDPAYLSSKKESRIRILSFRSAVAIAACLVITFIISRFVIVPKSSFTTAPTLVSYSAKLEAHAFAAESSAKESESLAMNGEPDRSAAFRRRESAPEDLLADSFDRVEAPVNASPTQLGAELLRGEKKIGESNEEPPSAMAQAEPPSDKITDHIQRRPSAPSNSAAKVIASSTSSPSAIPVPPQELATNEFQNFGDSMGFGGGFSDAKNADFRPQEPGNASEKNMRARQTTARGGELSKDESETKRMEKVAATKSDYYRTAADQTRSELLMQADTAWKVSGPAVGIADTIESQPIVDEAIPDLAKGKKSIPFPDLSQETLATQDPFSTFSLNISDTSFQLARAAIEKGERPDPTSIKAEQFYNAIDYGDPAPSSREPVAAAIDQSAHPILPGRNLVRISVRTASTGRSAAQPLRLTLLVDQSGSMIRADRRAAMETALAQLSTLLTEQDQITVIGFSRTPHLLADSLPGNQANKLPDLINQTANEGGTNLEQAITLASELALRHMLNGAQNRIVLFTDGAANLGDADPDRLSEKVQTLRQQGLAFDIAGIGTDDLNDKLLAELARHGNGRYYLVGENTASNLAAQLAGAFRPAAENVKIQVKLNPERVGNYKLIGFEKDRLKTEDFRNDSVDAAELAADEAGVAMYQIQTLPEGSGEIGEVSIRFRDTASGEMVERTWTIPYDPTTPAFDKAAPKTQLATLALLAAQKLQGGPLADAISLGNFSETIAKLSQTYKNDPKTQQLLNLVRALK